MEPRFVTHTPLVVVGMRIVTKPMSPAITDLWSRFVQREHEISGVREPGATYGVMQMEPGDSGALSYLAGLSVSDQASPVPAGMTAVVIPAGQYAVGTAASRGHCSTPRASASYAYGIYVSVNASGKPYLP